MSIYLQDIMRTTDRIEELKRLIEEVVAEVQRLDRPQLRLIQGGKSDGCTEKSL